MIKTLQHPEFKSGDGIEGATQIPEILRSLAKLRTYRTEHGTYARRFARRDSK